ncbi:hypothetical protein [Candidatus Symbiopectobacterium sp. NZEC135]|uniref:hypothetical protein n=1 Tax=Candidatus Symbiopectobacterium sp. NZEC135 TaxID=2820471 RepID=UPI0022262472|nr:hypothetical protein [Candidatus Symbiopectobacterium sp. NZEC135]MCW2480940.1 hypothetical protein [Candidatus Symbiopectobacterium sp. NZEC135]
MHKQKKPLLLSNHQRWVKKTGATRFFYVYCLANDGFVSASRLLANTLPESEAHENLRRRLRMLELNLQQKGMSTDFLHGEYADRLHSTFSGERIAPEK